VILLFSSPFNNLMNLLIKGQIEKINKKQINNNIELLNDQNIIRIKIEEQNNNN
jgi:hypothetical protein